MLIVNVNIKIGIHEFDFVMNGQVNSSWKDITDKAKIEFPRNVRKFTSEDLLIQDLIHKGDRVEIQLGYDERLETEFVGYVSEVQLGIPLVVHCEDSMWLLKQSKVNMSWKNATLEEIIFDITPNSMEIEVAPVDIGSYYAKNASPAIILEDLKKRYGMKPFFRNEKLYVGFAYPFDEYKATRYNFAQNAKEKGKNLKYIREGDVRIQVKGISINAKGEKIESQFGDPDGAQRTLHYYNLSQTTLDQNVENDFKKLQYEGFRGSFNGFAIPFARHGDIAFIVDEFFPEHKGAYFVDRVKTTFGPRIGINRQIHLGPRASNAEINDVPL